MSTRTTTSETTTRSSPTTSGSSKPRDVEGGEHPSQQSAPMAIEPKMAISRLDKVQRDALLQQYRISLFNGAHIDEDFTAVSRILQKSDGVRLVNVPTAASQVVSNINTVSYTNQDSVTEASSAVYILRYDVEPWNKTSEFLDGHSHPDLGDLLLINVSAPATGKHVPFNMTTGTTTTTTTTTTTSSQPLSTSDSGTRARKHRDSIGDDKPVLHLLSFSGYDERPAFIIERPLKDSFRSLVVYNGEGEILGSVDLVLSLLKRKLVVYDNANNIVFNMKSFKLAQAQDIIIREKDGKDKVGLITRRFSSQATKDQNAGYDVFFPTNSDWTQRALLMATALYMDSLWISRLY